MQYEVVVIAHEAIGKHLGIEPGERMAYDIQKRMPVPIIDEDRLAPVTARGDMVDGAWEFNAQRTSHGDKLRLGEAKGKA